MSITRTLTEDIELFQLNDLFCRNQKSFYLYIANYAAFDGDENDKDIKPLRLHKIENLIDCIFSPNMSLSFYNAILDTDICSTIKQYHCDNNDKIIKQILSLASHYKCPIRAQVKSTAIDTQKLLKRYGFFEFPDRNDAFQYIDFYHNDNVFKSENINSDIKNCELDDSIQADCRMRKSEWGYVLPASFGYRNTQIYGKFYSNVWSRVEVGPTKPIRMFIAIKNDRVVGGCQVSLACGIACLFNVTTMKNERGKGIGKALSLAAMISARELNYRYMVLQASDMGSPVYNKLGFKSIPSYKIFVKIATAAWYYRIIEMLLVMFSIQRIQRLISIIQKPSKTFLSFTIAVIIILAIFIATIFG
jgi:GNAT superfamily N-acetyltransferase